MDKITHSAKTDGDGLGFDILSFDDEGNPKYIEVKTTKGQVDKPFYISGSELERSKKEGDNYYLYRLSNFDEKKMIADFIVLQGDLSRFCVNATEYEVVVKASEKVRK